MILFSPTSSKQFFPIVSDDWFVAAGGTLTWQTLRNGIRLNAQRGTTTGGGLAGALLNNSVSGEYRRNFSPNWSATIGASYSNGASVVVPAGQKADRVTTAKGYTQVDYKLAKHFSIQAEYARIHQPNSGATGLANQGNHNLVQVSLFYIYTRPLSQ